MKQRQKMKLEVDTDVEKKDKMSEEEWQQLKTIGMIWMPEEHIGVKQVREILALVMDEGITATLKKLKGERK